MLGGIGLLLDSDFLRLFILPPLLIVEALTSHSITTQSSFGSDSLPRSAYGRPS